ncbi:MAG TPA: histidine kinase dimerization/phospho-acceptor domain-containing protein [Gaiellaceae bacterium]|nr:histidine kinase dimerization/phospho-acceptor domain-containing protein [Gaiellaceae bacterium]
MAERDTHFARLVSLACHDLRTPLATVHGFARTLLRLPDVPEQQRRYLGMVDAASVQLTELLEDLGLAARIEAERWEPNVQEVELSELAADAFAEVDAGAVDVSGSGGTVRVERDAVVRALHNLARCALRHGGLQRVEAALEGEVVRLSPVAADVARIVLGEELRDLGAAVAVRAVRALGGSVEVDGETLVVRLPV